MSGQYFIASHLSKLCKRKSLTKCLFCCYSQLKRPEGSSNVSRKFSMALSVEGEIDSTSKFVSHLPDIVVNADHQRKMPYLNTLQGVLMFLDISGTKVIYVNKI